MKKILIVDDEESIIQLLSRAIQVEGVDVVTARQIEEAEYAINNTHFDVILADIRLTGVLGKEGLELLTYVKEKSHGTNVIIMTGYGSEEIEKEAYEKGASFYFDKPIDLHVLKSVLRDLGLFDSGARAENGRENGFSVGVAKGH